MDITLNGTNTDKFRPLRDQFEALWQDIEVGAALCVYHHGDRVVDLWGGYADRQQTKPWQADTLVNVYSAAKGMATLAFAILVDKGLAAYEDKVVEYWPEFGAEGKHQITIAQLLSHQAGLCGVETTLSVEDLYDPDYICDLLARQKPYWQPGQAAGYHAVTWGYFPLALIRRITGMSIGQYLQTQVAGPLNADVYIGLSDEQLTNCADLIGPNHARSSVVHTKQTAKSAPNKTTVDQALYRLSLMNPAISPFKHASSRAWRMAEIPASNGHASARGLAKMYAALTNKTSLDGITVISEAGLGAALKTEVKDQIDIIMGSKINRSRGFILNSDQTYGPNPAAFGHAGAGGSMAFADPDSGIAFAYVMNQMQPEGGTISRSKRLIDSLFNCL